MSATTIVLFNRDLRVHDRAHDHPALAAAAAGAVVKVERRSHRFDIDGSYVRAHVPELYGAIRG